ncbi:MAG: hypothetical protein P4L74_00430 [Candidatus Doudnabacteria bacterium]|nr:hypothetical protein [Candidatus Doudnabacteria bacterium]
MNPEQKPKGEILELHRVEEETGFKPNQLVIHKVTMHRGRVKGYLKIDNRTLLGVDVSGMSDKVLDTPDKWEKLSDN